MVVLPSLGHSADNKAETSMVSRYIITFYRVSSQCQWLYCCPHHVEKFSVSMVDFHPSYNRSTIFKWLIDVERSQQVGCCATFYGPTLWFQNVSKWTQRWTVKNRGSPIRCCTEKNIDVIGDFCLRMRLCGKQARGCSYYFSAATTFEFLSNNQLLALVRAHEYDDEGFAFHFNSEEFQKLDNRNDKSMPPLITVFSAPNYCDSYGNTVRCSFLATSCIAIWWNLYVLSWSILQGCLFALSR